VPDLGLKLEITQAGRLIDPSRRHHRAFAILDPAAWCRPEHDPVPGCWERKQQDPIGLIDEQNPNRLTKPNARPHDGHSMSTRRDGITSATSPTRDSQPECRSPQEAVATPARLRQAGFSSAPWPATATGIVAATAGKEHRESNAVFRSWRTLGMPVAQAHGTAHAEKVRIGRSDSAAISSQKQP